MVGEALPREEQERRGGDWGREGAGEERRGEAASRPLTALNGKPGFRRRDCNERHG